MTVPKIKQLKTKQLKTPKVKSLNDGRVANRLLSELTTTTTHSINYGVTLRNFLEQKTSIQLEREQEEKEQLKLLTAGKGGVHYGKCSSMARIAKSAVKRTYTKKKVHVPYKPTPQLHTLKSLKYIREFGIPD